MRRTDSRLLSCRRLCQLLCSLLLTGGLCSAAQLRVAQQSAPAAGPLYGVEVLIFRTSAPPAGENWDAVPPGRGFGNTIARVGPAPQLVRLLSSEDYRLSNLEGGLKASGAWRPLAHVAWIQSAANWGTHAGLSLADLGVNVPGLSGTVYLERAPVYLHLGFDVSWDSGANYTIKEMRSVRYNDKQYFDHPAFGIIAVVTPIRHASDSAGH